jgi:hypothetical protein
MNIEDKEGLDPQNRVEVELTRKLVVRFGISCLNFSCQ